MSTDDRLSKMERQTERCIVLLETLTAKVDQKCAEDSEWQKEADLFMYGDGESNRGLNLRVDRLEQIQDRQKWFMRALGAGLMTLMAKVGSLWFVR